MFCRFHLKPVAASKMAGSIAGAPTGADLTTREGRSVSVGRRIMPLGGATSSSTAMKMLRHIADARAALPVENPGTEEAAAQVSQSDKMSDVVRPASPTTQVTHRIRVAKRCLEFEDTEKVLPDLVPMKFPPEGLVDHVPSAQANAHLDKAKQALKEGNKPKAAEQLRALDDAFEGAGLEEALSSGDAAGGDLTAFNRVDPDLAALSRKP